MERFDGAVQKQGVVVSHLGHRNVALKLKEDFPHLGFSAGDILGVDVDGALYEGALLAVSSGPNIFLAYCSQWRGDFCFWLMGQRYPVRRATWGDSGVPVVLGLVFASGRVL